MGHCGHAPCGPSSRHSPGASVAERKSEARDEYDGDLERHSHQESGSAAPEKRGMSEMAGPSAGGVPPDTDVDEQDAGPQATAPERGESNTEQAPGQPPQRRERQQ